MSRKYREYKANLIELYRYYGGISVPYKITLYQYKKFKRKIQRQKKDWIKFRRSIKKGAVFVIDSEGVQYL